MIDLDKLLKKRKWTGRELGILEVEDMAVSYKEIRAGKEAKGLIDWAVLQKMVDKIEDINQWETYHGYIAIHNWLDTYSAMAEAEVQQVQLHCLMLDKYISQALLTEDIYEYIERLPAIMTQKQLDDLKAERLEAYTKGEDGEEFYSNIFNLIERAISYYLKLLEENSRKANPLKAIEKKYSKQPVKSKIILSRYNEVVGNGYYIMEDGSGEKLDPAYLVKNVDFYQSIMNDAVRAVDRTEEDLLNFSYSLMGKQVDLEDRGRFTDKVSWHLYEEPPQDLKKWDIIKQELLLRFYPCDLDGSGDEYSNNNFNASMKDFVEEFPELVKAMLSDMDKKYFSKDKIKASNTPVEEWGDTTISWKRLIELNFYGEKEEATSYFQTFIKNRRALYNGVAIIQEIEELPILKKTALPKGYIDEKGYYIEPGIISSLSQFSLEGFFTESEYYADNAEAIETARKMILNSLYFLKGYNLAVDITAEYYDIPDIDIFKQDTDTIEKEIDLLNDQMLLLYSRIKNADYKDKALQARKLEVLEDFFSQIDYSNAEPSKEKIEEAREYLGGFKAYTGKGRELFYNLLCIKPDEEEEGF